VGQVTGSKQIHGMMPPHMALADGTTSNVGVQETRHAFVGHNSEIVTACMA
jgi:hypothetical protein